MTGSTRNVARTTRDPDQRDVAGLVRTEPPGRAVGRPPRTERRQPPQVHRRWPSGHDTSITWAVGRYRPHDSQCMSAPASGDVRLLVRPGPHGMSGLRARADDGRCDASSPSPSDQRCVNDPLRCGGGDDYDGSEEWSGLRDLNPHPRAHKARALQIALRPDEFVLKGIAHDCASGPVGLACNARSASAGRGRDHQRWSHGNCADAPTSALHDTGHDGSSPLSALGGTGTMCGQAFRDVLPWTRCWQVSQPRHGIRATRTSDAQQRAIEGGRVPEDLPSPSMGGRAFVVVKDGRHWIGTPEHGLSGDPRSLVVREAGRR